MLLVPTILKPSPIAGIGLFAQSPISRGEKVWEFKDGFDLLFVPSQIEELSSEAQRQFHNYAFLDTHHSKHMLCGDDARFFNHSPNPNCDDSQPDVTTAIKNIEAGEELTVDYLTFYGR